MLKLLVAGTALALIASSAVAQDAAKAPLSLDQQIEQAQTQVYAAEAQRNMLYARKLQAANVEAAQQAAATAAWWAAWWQGMFPATPAPAASAAPQK